ncbi:unnamed protein product [Gongylonema pulchrum]|uniref:Cation transporter n=1 Tax=Gongylonema pulchrum TaxID=637853 RepID=A0A183EDS2_9BILA|nr:unnamed protein product [Gongylonema pulchrum]
MKLLREFELATFAKNFWLLVFLFSSFTCADREHVEHGYSGKFRKEHGADDEQQHNVHADHKVIVGL